MTTKAVERIAFPDGCHERWLPLTTAPLAVLRGKALKCSGISHLVPGYSIYRERPDSHLVLYTLGGKGSCHDRGHTFMLTRGMVFITACDYPQYYKTHGDHWDILFFHIYSRPPWVFEKETGMVVRPGTMLDDCLLAEEGLLREAPIAAAGASELCDAYCQLLVAALERELREFIDRRAHAWRQPFEALWTEVDGTLARDWRVAELAQRLSVSPPHFRRLCRQVCGCAPLAMVTRLRMNRATELLRETGLPAKQVCGRVGYGNPQAFSTTFRRVTGTSPRAYRQAAGCGPGTNKDLSVQ